MNIAITVCGAFLGANLVFLILIFRWTLNNNADDVVNSLTSVLKCVADNRWLSAYDRDFINGVIEGNNEKLVRVLAEEKTLGDTINIDGKLYRITRIATETSRTTIPTATLELFEER